MIEKIPGIYEIELKNNDGGTGTVSVFLIPGKNEERSLMVDAGFSNEKSKSQMEAAIRQLEIPIESLDVFITHKHHDHCGLAGLLSAQGAKVYMSQVEDRHRYDCLSCHYSHSAMEEQWNVLKTVGITLKREPEIWNKYMEVNERVENRQRWLFAVEDFPYIPLTEGQQFSCGGYRFETLPLPGHTLGQMGLIEPSQKILFCADQVIDGIIPIVSTTHVNEHLLEHYFESLEMIKHRFVDYQIISSHNGDINKLPEVIDQIAYSYLKKLDLIKRVLERNPGSMTVKDIACLSYGMNRVPADDSEFIKLKMVISKTFSCLEYLYGKELVMRIEEEGILYWRAVDSLIKQ